MADRLYLIHGVDEAWHDTEGRPLGEGAVESTAPMERRACPWPGSRHQHANPMNVSALKQLHAHWDAALAAIATLRTAFIAARGPPTTHWELWRLVEVGLTWPAFLVHRRDGPADPQQLPPLVAVVYKLLKGVSPLAHHQAVSSLLPSGAGVPMPDSGALYDWAEAHGKLVGPNEVCAGSEVQIRRLLSAVIDGEGHTGAPVEPGLIDAGLAFAQFGLLRFLHRLARTVAVEDARPQLEAAPAFRAVLAESKPGPLSGAVRDAPHAARAALLEPIAAQQGTTEALALAHTWDTPEDGLAARVEQIDRAFLAGCVPLCIQLRRALGHDAAVPMQLLDNTLIDHLCSPALGQALHVRSAAPPGP